MKKNSSLIILLLALMAIGGVAAFLWNSPPAVFDPKGAIARQERDLIVTLTLLMLVIVLPVYLLVFFVAWKYRKSNTLARYAPNKHHTLASELIWWLLPAIVVLALAVVTWKATHALDPYKPLDSDVKPLRIQVVALRWKWLFIYPEQNLATVNFLEFPVHTPLNFELTADNAPMSSFWIPQLGGQIYAMSGMSTKLHLIADEPGEFAGRAAEINGEGFSGMTFTAKAVPQTEFDAWVSSTRVSAKILSMDEYHALAKPSENVPSSTYSGVFSRLYDDIIAQFMSPDGVMPDMEGMDM